jgi:uncharacterized protein Yka (UPF0111/DUF47 family)
MGYFKLFEQFKNTETVTERITPGNARDVAHKVLNMLVGMGLIPEKKKDYQLVSDVAGVIMAVKESSITEAGDHEVSMAQGQLDTIIKLAQELKNKIGIVERDIPGWIQDHISKSENYILQAANNFHEVDENLEERLSDVEPEKGKMHKLLGLKDDEKITDVYTSGEKLAKDLVKALKGDQKEAAGMLAYAANISSADNVLDDALSALKDM